MAPASQLIKYKMAAFVWCCVLGLAPAYLAYLYVQKVRSLRTIEQVLRHIPFARTSTRKKLPYQWMALQFGKVFM